MMHREHLNIQIHATGGIGNQRLMTWHTKQFQKTKSLFPFFEVVVLRIDSFGFAETVKQRYTEDEFYKVIQDWVTLVGAHSGTGGLFNADPHLLTRLSFDLSDTHSYHTLASVKIRGHMENRLMFDIELMEL